MKVAIIKTMCGNTMSIESHTLERFGRIKRTRDGFTEIYDDCEELSIVVRTEDVQSIVIGVVSE